MNQRKGFFAYIILSFLLLILLTGTAGATFDSGKSKLVFGDDIDYPPFSYINERGQASGFNVELAKAIGKAMGYEVEVRLGEWDSIRKALKNGEIDAISGMFYSEERKQFVDFASRQLVSNGDIFTKKGVVLASVYDLKDQTVLVQKGDFVGEYLDSLNLNIHLVQVSTVEGALRLVQEGTYDYAGLAKLPGLYSIKRDEITGISAQGFSLATNDYSMAVNKGNEELLLILNSGLQVVKATGEYDKIYNRYLSVYQDLSLLQILHKHQAAVLGVLCVVLVLIAITLLLNYIVRVRTKQLRQSNQDLSIKQRELEELIWNMKALEAEVNAERNLFKTTLHSLGDGVISTDGEGRVDLMNAVAETLTGWHRMEAKGLPFETVFPIVNEYTGEPCVSPIEQVLERGETVQLANHTMLIKKNGDRIPIEDSAAPIKDETGQVNGVVLVFRDFTDKKEKQERIQFLSRHDQLTGLYNRHYFEEQIKTLDLEANLPLTVAMADVNGLKLTNDAFGHKEGDSLLQVISKALQAACSPTDVLARVGGDEFVLLLPKTSRMDAELLMNRIEQALSREKVDKVIVSVSFGWETKERSDQSIVEALARAEEHMYRRKLEESKRMRYATIQLIMKTLGESNEREKIHLEKVCQISCRIGKALHLDQETMRDLERTALMHDVGKIAVNQDFLNKNGVLTESELDEVKRHPEIGYHIVKSVDDYANLAEYILSHHERWDGKGYPRGISEEKIPLISRILAVADAFEAMTADRPYRKAISADRAMEEIKRCSGAQFDPTVVAAFLESEMS